MPACEQSSPGVHRSAIFAQGFRDGLPIGMGYLAVSFSLGIAFSSAGFTPGQSFITSLLCNASAGEYAGVSLVAVQATYIEVALMTLIANLRYLLMSLAFSQRFRPGESLLAKSILAFDLSDELFAIQIARAGYIDPVYGYGAILAAWPFWAIGTAIGCMTGDVLPVNLVSALSVALFGMFIAVIIPPIKTNARLGAIIAVSFALSAAANYLPVFAAISSGMRTIILSLVICAAAALLFPRKEEET